MYEPFYGLKESPFNLTPDSRFLFLSDQHRAAMAALLYGIEQRKGFICLTGEIGSGKTTLCRALINQLHTRHIRIGVILNSYLSDIELLRTINDEFGLESHFETKKDLIDVLNRFLIEENRQGHIVTLIIDEAQNLPPQTLEQIRMLGNLESEVMKLFQIVLVGQPELADLLARPDLEQLEQRISVRFHLRSLTEEEMLHYIRHRLLVAGSNLHIDFSAAALQKIREFTKGIPRRINVLCDRCLLIGFVNETFEINEEIVNQAIEEVTAPRKQPEAQPQAVPATGFHHLKVAAILAVAIGALGAVTYLALGTNGPPPVKASEPLEIANLETPSPLPTLDAEDDLLPPLPVTLDLASSPTLATSAPAATTMPATVPATRPESLPTSRTIETRPVEPLLPVLIETPDLTETPDPKETPEEKPKKSLIKTPGPQTPKPAKTPNLKLTPLPRFTPLPFPITPTPLPAIEPIAAQEIEGVVLTAAPPPSIPPVIAPPASRPVPAPTTLGKDSWTYDEDGIVRVTNPGTAQLASVLTLGRLWEARANLSKFREQAYEKNAAVDPIEYGRESLGLELVDQGQDYQKALKADQPMLVELDGGSYAALISIYEGRCVLSDPIQGLRTVEASRMPAMVRRMWSVGREGKTPSKETRLKKP